MLERWPLRVTLKNLIRAPTTKILRSLDEPTERAARSEKAPPHIALAIKQEVTRHGAENATKVYSKWFQIYREADKKWAIVEISIKAVVRQRTWRKGNEKWLNPQQMLEHFKNPVVVQAIKNECELDGSKTMPHPSAPTCEDAKLYLCVVDLEQGFQEEGERQQDLRMRAQLDGDAAETLAPMLLNHNPLAGSNLPLPGSAAGQAQQAPLFPSEGQRQRLGGDLSGLRLLERIQQPRQRSEAPGRGGGRQCRFQRGRERRLQWRRQHHHS